MKLFDEVHEPVGKEDIKNKPWFSPPELNYGRDFKPEDLRPGMVFMHRHYTMIIGPMQLLKRDKVVSIPCLISGRLVEFIGVVSIEVINKSLYIGSANMEDSKE